VLRSRSTDLVSHAPVQPLDIVRGEGSETDIAKHRDDVAMHVHVVCEPCLCPQCALAHGEPFVEPAAQGGGGSQSLAPLGSGCIRFHPSLGDSPTINAALCTVETESEFPAIAPLACGAAAKSSSGTRPSHLPPHACATTRAGQTSTEDSASIPAPSEPWRHFNGRSKLPAGSSAADARAAWTARGPVGMRDRDRVGRHGCREASGARRLIPSRLVVPVLRIHTLAADTTVDVLAPVACTEAVHIGTTMCAFS